MIQAYAGEFTVSPFPLEMSMNFCSHKCHYCFANLNQPGRTLDVKKSINQIKNCRKNKGLTNYLLANGYPVLLSNRVDPFAKTNWRQSLTFIELLQENGNKVAYQTKGGDGIDEALSLMDYKSSWYIGISMIDDNIRQLIEPGAPTISERFELIDKLITQGHHVSVGINPLVEEWLPVDKGEELCNRIYNLGVRDIWLQPLHLNKKQISRMSEKEVNSMDGLLENASKRYLNYSYCEYLAEYFKELGGNAYSGFYDTEATQYHMNAAKFYDKRIKTSSEFIKHCYNKLPDGGIVRFSDYYNFLKEDYFEMQFSDVDGFAYRIARNAYKDYVERPLKTLKEVLEFYWLYPVVSKSLFKNDLFGRLAIKSGKEHVFVTDKNDKTWIAYFNAGKEFEYTVKEKQLADYVQLKDIV